MQLVSSERRWTLYPFCVYPAANCTQIAGKQFSPNKFLHCSRDIQIPTAHPRLPAEHLPETYIGIRPSADDYGKWDDRKTLFSLQPNIMKGFGTAYKGGKRKKTLPHCLLDPETSWWDTKLFILLIMQVSRVRFHKCDINVGEWGGDFLSKIGQSSVKWCG